MSIYEKEGNIRQHATGPKDPFDLGLLVALLHAFRALIIRLVIVRHCSSSTNTLITRPSSIVT